MNTIASFNTLILDLGDVLFSWSAETITSIAAQQLKAIISSCTWFEYERGLIGQDVCYERLGTEFSISPSEIEQAFQQARDSLRSNDDLIALVKELKNDSHLKVFAMSNISTEDFQILQTKSADWSVFDKIFTSGSVGERKPSLGFFRYVIAETRIDPHRTVFVDDNPENVLSARSLGMNGVRFENASDVRRILKNLFGDPILRGRQFLQAGAGRHYSLTENGVELRENFAQLILLELTEDRSLVDLVEQPGVWNFFQGPSVLTTADYPSDFDTTSLGLTVMRVEASIANPIMDDMLRYINKDGIIQTYFDHGRPRFDPVVCVNVLCLFFSYGRGQELQSTLNWVVDVLTNRAYLDGTRYYTTGESFLYFIMRLLQRSGDLDLHSVLKPLLKQRIQERIAKEGDAIALAMRIIVCEFVDVRNKSDLDTLLTLQCEDGGWKIGSIYGYGSSGVRIGNRGLTTALAVNAIEVSQRFHSPALILEPLHVNSGATKRHRRSSSFRNSLQWLISKGRRAETK
ncbi:Haloacid dehalogenase-like hydrolase-domain-containing protein [Mycena floridula]|nr:Haloacid dehalogenase-like hydrolase-domain-containing protein [Mycena floridula]